MTTEPLSLRVMHERLAVCRLAPDAAVKPHLLQVSFVSITRTPEELSLVVPEELAEPAWRAECGWRSLMVEGPLDFSLTGILAGLATVLAQAGISIFAVSTFDTDYLLVQSVHLDAAIVALEQAGHSVRRDEEKV